MLNCIGQQTERPTYSSFQKSEYKARETLRYTSEKHCLAEGVVSLSEAPYMVVDITGNRFITANPLVPSM